MSLCVKYIVIHSDTRGEKTKIANGDNVQADYERSPIFINH
jgi:hypothetical protein